MNPIENSRTVAQELVSLARERGLDLEVLRNDFAFRKDRRWSELWRKDELPCSGPVDEQEGTLHYSMQGEVSVLPSTLEGAGSAFHGAWNEAGTFEDLEQAFELVRAWLLERREVDDLPGRSVRRCGV